MGQKFCSDAHRNTYNNRLKADDTNVIRNTHNALRKNHRILKSLIDEGKKKVNRLVLDNAGFNFSLHTTTKGDLTGVYNLYYTVKLDIVYIDEKQL